jgi:hypothetical protein
MSEAVMITTYSVIGTLTLEIAGDLKLPAEIRSEIDALWAATVAQRPNLFDGPILTVVSPPGNHLCLARASYRHLMAARRSPVMAGLLNLRPLAVSGILTCSHGVVLGQRSKDVTQGAEQWELVPSGGLKPSPDGGVPDVRAQILKELEEETGLGPDQVAAGQPIGMIEDTDSGVIDIVIPLSTQSLTSQILAAHETLGSSEYSGLQICPTSRIRSSGLSLLPETKAIIETWIR